MGMERAMVMMMMMMMMMILIMMVIVMAMVRLTTCPRAFLVTSSHGNLSPIYV